MTAINQIVVQNTTGKVIIAGSFVGLTNPNIRDGNYDYSKLARLMPNGDLDLTYKKASGVTNYGGEAVSLTTLTDDRIICTWRGVAVADINKMYAEFFAADGSKDNSFTFPYSGNFIARIFREAPDIFLIVGDLGVNGTKRPVVRLKK